MVQFTATADIDLNALRNNFTTIKAITPEAKILAVLKANAYGHGLVRIAKALCEADAFGVARIDEALELRDGGIIKPIVLLEGFFDPLDLPIIAVNNFQTVIHNIEQLQAIEQVTLAEPIHVWLKIDTGMHRLGINPKQFSEFYQRLTASKNVHSHIRLMSHLGCADLLASPQTSQQIELFEQLTAGYSAEKSMANSAAILAWPQSHYQWVRPGLILYGVPALKPEQQRTTYPLDPVMTLHSSLIAIRDIKAGDSVGYGAAWTTPQDTRIGVIAIGYGDGYPRHAKNGCPVLINGRLVPLIGRVSMDMITVDLGENADDKVGDYVELWGKNLPVSSIAKHSETIPYELLCNITRRVKIDVI